MSIDSMTVPPRPLQRRFRTRPVRVGGLVIGGDAPVLVQSMTIADTTHTDVVVDEVMRLVQAGCPLVRLTAPSIKDAANLRHIRARLKDLGIHVPMVADIHFTPNAALLAAEIVEKVRINPGNYADRKRFQVFEITPEAYRLELQRVRERFVPLVHKLREHGAALRIGTNHGSLSDRIMNRFGDTPEGMVESALEFVRICRDEAFHDIVLSMKSSIPSVMIAAYRLLVRRMVEEGMNYPIHLGVTEAGNGLEGRVKSAVGIGALLTGGIGDTIRVSLTEDAEHEVPAAGQILSAVAQELDLPAAAGLAGPEPRVDEDGDVGSGAAFVATLPAVHPRRRARTAFRMGALLLAGDHPIGVGVATCPEPASFRVDLGVALARHGSDESPEFVTVRVRETDLADLDARLGDLRDFLRERTAAGGELPLLLDFGEVAVSTVVACAPADRAAWWTQVDAVRLQAPPAAPDTAGPDTDPDTAEAAPLGLTDPDLPGFLDEIAGMRLPLLWQLPPPGWTTAATVRGLWQSSLDSGVPVVGFSCGAGPHWTARVRALAAIFANDEANRPWIHLEVPGYGAAPGILAGSVLIDGIGDSLVLLGEGELIDRGGSWKATRWSPGGVAFTEEPLSTAYTLLQACRLRLTRAEFIACPSCGRTQFDLQTTTARIRHRTQHLKGVKIAIMGCIVNGPGEMADADFGYVGSGPEKVDLYVGKERIAKSIHQAEAEDRLVALIREHGRWIDP